MLPDFSLAYLTAASLTAAQAIDAAQRIGYRQVGLRLLPAVAGGATQGLLEDAALLREAIARSTDTGVGVFDLEMIRLDERFDAGHYVRFFEAGQVLGAKAILVAADDRDEARLAASFAALCEAARPYGLTADLEFMPWTAVPDVRSAQRLLLAAGSPDNAGVLVDALHFDRSRSRPEDLDELPERWLHYAQICDATAGIPATDAELIHTARCARLLPGEGGLDLKATFSHLPAGLPISVEVPNDVRIPVVGAFEWARQAFEAARTVMGDVQ